MYVHEFVCVCVCVCVCVLPEHLKFRNVFPVLKCSMDDTFERIWKKIFAIKSR